MIRDGESIRWYPRVRICRYSIDQTRWALAHLMTRQLHGDDLAVLFPLGPEDGYAYDEGNSMVNGGLTNLISLLTGATPSGSAGRPLSLGLGGGVAGSAVVGVGTDGSTAFAAAQTHLANATGEGGSNSFYQSMDTGYPTLTTPAQINGQSTFQAAQANFNWYEWCWAAGAGVPTAGPVLSSVYATSGSGVMMNRKIPVSGLGQKMPGAAWVFQTSVTFSLFVKFLLFSMPGGSWSSTATRSGRRLARCDDTQDHRRPGSVRPGLRGLGRPGLPGTGQGRDGRLEYHAADRVLRRPGRHGTGRGADAAGA